ncbi:hypothetical protein BGZ88_006213 [Linnemannia elongata]|nr:hypothetical protein BGZ88_006213 [Linnemannia elongata]KAG0045767.1 hypothetical protein BGZ89_005511 [Linnemannia elongata]KAK5822815.1 hypothetical protein F5H01DRAFT_150967 [Linnemannia elongata]
MGQFYDEMSADQQDWIHKQKMFIVASAPLSATGTINASPKGYDCFRIIDANKACYLEMTGSGIETQSHVEENGRLTIMFMAFEGAPKILRLFGRGHVCRVDTPEYQRLYDAHYRGTSPDFEAIEGKRSIIVITVEKVGISCGFGVPYYEYKENRPTLLNYWGKKTEDQVADYWVKKNKQSVDGLPGMKHERMDEVGGCEYQKDVPPPVMANKRSVKGGSSPLGWIAELSQTQLLTIGAVAAAAFGAGVAASSTLLLRK